MRWVRHVAVGRSCVGALGVVPCGRCPVATGCLAAAVCRVGVAGRSVHEIYQLHSGKGLLRLPTAE
eukprot:9186790-Pyramimonas_sp.AAC.1